jgi:hypothetical protein
MEDLPVLDGALQRFLRCDLNAMGHGFLRMAMIVGDVRRRPGTLNFAQARPLKASNSQAWRRKFLSMV